jgi:hypothetical protein
MYWRARSSVPGVLRPALRTIKPPSRHQEFREEYYKVGAKDDDKIAAVNYLAQHRRERIVAETAPRCSPRHPCRSA